MADTALPAPRTLLGRADRVWLATGLVVALTLVAVPGAAPAILGDALDSLARTSVFIAFAVLAVATLKATGAETILARAFEGRETRAILTAGLLGGISPFCSCEVIPFIAAMLALGAPLSAAMAFWLASPLMDPAMFFITAGALGPEFALAKLLAAVAIGLGGGFAVRALGRTGLFADPLRPGGLGGGCCGARRAFSGRPVWRFWTEAERRVTFRETATANALFLVKWLALAYLLEALMVRYVPADAIGAALGGEGFGTILLATLIGGPAYLNGYAAPPLVAGLIEQGMAPGAGMAFLIAGGVSCIPAAIAVWALVRPRVFAGYLGLAVLGAVAAGTVWGAVA